jgi:pimeloyl-ACP methyl ester carboxylesterase
MLEPLQLPVRGLTFEALAAGPPTGELVVSLHGFPQTSACWTLLLETLAAAGYRAVAPDQRGYSPTARPTTVSAYRLPELVADVVAIADRLDAETFHLVGHDWGGVVAWRLAGQQPERVATLTAVSTPHPRAFARALLAGTQGLRSAYIPVFRLPRLPELLLGAHRQWGLRRLLAQDGLGADWVDTYTRALAQPGALSAALAWYRAATPFSLLAPRASVPTLYVWGSGDPAAAGTPATVEDPTNSGGRADPLTANAGPSHGPVEFTTSASACPHRGRGAAIRQGSEPGGDPPKPPGAASPPGPTTARGVRNPPPRPCRETGAAAPGFTDRTLFPGGCPVLSSSLLYWPVGRSDR